MSTSKYPCKYKRNLYYTTVYHEKKTMTSLFFIIYIERFHDGIINVAVLIQTANL